ncbi:hypothetical protein NX059_007155 [Plenodomus lindquistii]|nr:hypothetical protein NX059_007155 [Plenodomus lindquistii]
MEDSVYDWINFAGTTFSDMFRRGASEFAELEKHLLTAVEKTMTNYAKNYDHSVEVLQLLMNPPLRAGVEGQRFIQIDLKWLALRRSSPLGG